MSQIWVRTILEAVADVTGISEELIAGEGQNERVTDCRAVVSWLAVRHTKASHTQIGRVIKRDRTQALRGYQRVEAQPEKFKAVIAAAERRFTR